MSLVAGRPAGERFRRGHEPSACWLAARLTDPLEHAMARESTHERLDAEAVHRFARMLDEAFSEIAPSIRPGDRVMLTLQALERRAEEKVLPWGTLHLRHFTRPNVLAAGALAEVLARTAASPARGLSLFRETRRLLRVYAVWTRKIVGLQERERSGASLDATERNILGAWLFVRGAFGPPRGGFLAGAREARTGVGQPNEEVDSLLQDLGFYKALLHEKPAKSGAFLGKDGKMRLDWRDLRDVIERTEGSPRVRSRQRDDALDAVSATTRSAAARTCELLDEMGVADDAPAASEAAAASEQAALAVRQHERFRVWLEGRKRACTVASHQLVLDHLPALLNVEGSQHEGLRDLADVSGIPYRTLQSALKAELAACRADLASPG